MKTFSVAVAVAVVLAVLLIQESSATSTEVQDLEEEVMSNDYPAAESADQEMSEDSWMMPYPRHKRSLFRRIRCRFCCNGGACGICCRRKRRSTEE